MYQRRRDNRVQREDEQQNFFMSLSDLMSGLNFIFIIALVVFALNLGSSEVDYKAELEKVTQEREQLKERLQKLEVNVVELRDLAHKLKQNIDLHLAKTADLRLRLLSDINKDIESLGSMRVSIDANQGILRLPNEVLFPSGSAQLGPEGEKNLKILAGVMERHLPCYAGLPDSQRPKSCTDRQWNPGTLDAVFIEGHTDNIPLSRANPHQSNIHLSGMRAIQTFKTLLLADDTGAGKALEQLRNPKGQPIFGISGYGEHRPVVDHATPTAEPANRRIDVRFLLTNTQPPSIIPQLLEELDRLTQQLDRLK
ncbi:MAG: hypothetical protein HQL60_03615 [Magnetococcales bacterium]|nr:hypothetical protein [Magnetococcales bacterium]